jgi:malate dehydrogenase (oxaloacetate-decarboxylating)
MMQEGLSREDAVLRLFLIDRRGLLTTKASHADERQKAFLHPLQDLKTWRSVTPDQYSLMEVVQNARPTVLIGVSGQGGVFTQELIREMSRHVERPIVFPLSNPTSKSECIPADVLEWTQGKAILATGSPFAPVPYSNRQIVIAQCNNVYIFPGLGLGCLAAGATQVSDGMLLAASRILAEHSPALKDATASLFPRLEEVRTIARLIAIGVAREAIKEKLSSISFSEVEERVDRLIWTPHYAKYVAV